MGLTLSHEMRKKFLDALILKISLDQSDRKVLRWALNALRYVAFIDECRNQVEAVIGRFSDDVEIGTAAVALLFSLDGQAYQYLAKRERLLPETILLGAMQVDKLSLLDTHFLDSTTIDIEKGTPEILLSSLIAIGLGNAKENLFHPSYQNEDLVRELGQHDNEVIKQYTVWAISENDKIPMSALGLSLDGAASLAANVRGWMLHLHIKRSENVGLVLELVQQEKEETALLEFSRALPKSCYLSGHDDAVLACFSRQSAANTPVAENLIRYFANCSEYSEKFSEVILSEFDGYLDKSPDLAQVVLEQSSGKRIYTELKRKEAISKEGGLLIGGDYVAGDKFENSGVIGALALNGDAVNSGQVLSISNEQSEVFQDLLNRVLEMVHKEETLAADIDQIMKLIDGLKASPEKPNLATLLDILKKAQPLLGVVASLQSFLE